MTPFVRNQDGRRTSTSSRDYVLAIMMMIIIIIIIIVIIMIIIVIAIIIIVIIAILLPAILLLGVHPIPETDPGGASTCVPRGRSGRGGAPAPTALSLL